jgi:hypothetical protein
MQAHEGAERRVPPSGLQTAPVESVPQPFIQTSTRDLVRHVMGTPNIPVVQAPEPPKSPAAASTPSEVSNLLSCDGAAASMNEGDEGNPGSVCPPNRLTSLVPSRVTAPLVVTTNGTDLR